MTTKVGFLHDQAMNLGTVLSETDSESKYSVEVEQTNSEIDNDSAELSVIEFDTSQDLDSANGMKIENINTGPLLDKHSNYRNGDLENYSLGVARFGIKDYADSSSANKSKDEYWCANTFQPGNDIGSLYDTLIHNGHWTGSVMMYAYTKVNVSDSDKQDIYVRVRNESTKVWGSQVLVTIASNKVFIGGVSKFIENYPTFCTIPNLGTLLFYFGTTEDSQASTGGINAEHSNQLVHIWITKDDGVTWEEYGNFVIDPFYGDTSPPQTLLAYASTKAAVLKVIYYNNKLVVGMMLQGTDSSTVAIQERIGWGTAGTTDSYTYTTKYPIKQDGVSPPTLTLRKNGNGTVGSGTSVASDNGSGTITGAAVTGTISNYKAGTIEFNEFGAGAWGANESVEVEYELGGLHFYRILNIMYSSDIGKSWTTVPYEFIQGSYEGPTPAGDYLLGDPTSSDYRYCLPSSFGFGYDIHSDKVILVLRSSGLYFAEDFDYPYNFDNVGKTYFFYNRTDDLFEWGSSVVNGRTYRMLDSFYVDSLDDYAEYTYAALPPNWFMDGDTLHQDVSVNGPGWSADQLKGGAHLIFNKEDPTLNRTVGIHIDLMADDSVTLGMAFCRKDQSNMYGITLDTTNSFTQGTAVLYLKKVTGGTESTLSSATIEYASNSWIEISVYFDPYDIITVHVNGVGKINAIDNEFRDGKIALVSNFAAVSSEAQYDNLGLHTCRTIRTIPGGGFSAQSGWYNEDRPQVGANIDLTNDNFGQSWMAADVATIDMGNSTHFNYIHCGIAFQKYRLSRDVERVEGKFLATDSYSVVFADEDHYERDIQYFLALQDFGLFVTQYDTGSNTTARRKPTLENFEWHYGDPNFFIYRDNDGYYQYSSALIERAQYSDHNMFANYGSTWHAMTYSVEPQYAGWEESGSFSYTQEDRYILNVAKSHYFLQSFDPNSDTLSTNGSFAMSVVQFDFEYRGITAFFSTISDSGNDTNADRTIFEATIPGYYRDVVEPTGYAFADNGGVFTDETAAANNVIADDMTLMQAVPAVNDAYYWGDDNKFSAMKLIISTSGAGTWTIAWEYYNGSTWTILTIKNQNIVDFTEAAATYINGWDFPTDWTKNTVNGQSAYWVRARVATYTSITTQPLGQRSWMSYLGPGIHERARIRVKADDAATAGYEAFYYNYDTTTWVSVGSLVGIDIKNTWWDIAVYLIPKQRTSDRDLKLNVLAREEGSSYWKAIANDDTVPSYSHATPVSEVKFGAFDASAETNNRQKFKFCGYSDTSYINPNAVLAAEQVPIRGETVQSGERVYATKGIVFTVGGGISMEGDEWTLTDLTRRDNAKESVVDRPSVLWISDDDSADKSVIIDAQHELEYDTLVLCDVNCKQIVFESDDNSSFPSPTVQATLDMVKYSSIPFATELNKETIINITTNNIFKINEFLDDIVFVTYSTNERAYRIIRNTHDRIIYDENGAAPSLPTSITTGTIDILARNIAVKFSSRYRDRYFRITMKKSTFEYPTPEGEFQIGRVAIGVFDQLQENPEYPEVTDTVRKNKMVKLASNSYKQKFKASPTTQKTLNFRAIDSYAQRGFLAQLQSIFGNADGYNPMFYVPDIEELVLSSTPYGTYTFNIFPFYYANKMTYPEKWGNLSDVTLVLKEYK